MRPERQLLEQFAAGELDQQLVAIADAVQGRLELLHTVRSARALAERSVGDTVMFTAKVRPRYLEHERAVIEAVGDRSVTVRLRRPVERFGDGTLRCPPLALRKLSNQRARRRAEREGKTLSELARDALAQYVAIGRRDGARVPRSAG